MTVEELQAKVDAIEKERVELQKKVEGLDSLNGKRGQELGDIRKQMEEFQALKDAVKSLTEDRDSVKKELDALKSNAPVKREDTSTPASKTSDKELADKLESELTDAEKKEVEGFVEKLTADDKKAFVDNDTFRVAVLKQAKSGEDKANPDSIWRLTKKPKASGEDLEAKVKDLFKKHKSGSLIVDERGGGYGTKREVKTEKPVKFI